MPILTTADRFRNTLEKLLLDEVDRLKETVSLGFLDDYAQYKQLAGKISGLRMAIDLINEAERQCNSYGEEGRTI